MKTFPVTVLLFIFVAVALSSFSQTANKTVILCPGPANGMDAVIRTDIPDLPAGTSADFIANAWTAQGNFFIERSLLKFDLTGIPVQSNILQATLYLYTNLNTGNYQLDSGANAASLLRVRAPWVASQVTWNTQPAWSSNDSVPLAQSVSHTESYMVDVTAHVSDMVANPGGNQGWLIKLRTEERYRCMVFASSNNQNEAWRPKLVIQYTNCTAPSANFSYAVNARNVQFTDLSSPAISWLWNFGDGGTSTLQNPEHIFTAPGNYQVCLQVTDSCGSSTYCNAVTVSCDPPVAGFTYSSALTTVSFTDTTNCPFATTRLWAFGDGATSTDQNPVHQYSEYGSYKVYLTVTDSCGSDAVFSQVTISEPPLLPGFTSTQNSTDNLEVAFTDHSTGATWWLWKFGDGTSSSEQNPVHVYDRFGEYQVCQTAGNVKIQETACNTLKVTKTGITAAAGSILFYPNPCPGDGNLTFILFEDAGVATITLKDLAGRVIFRQEFMNVMKNVPVELKTNGLVKGTYLLEGAFNNYRKIMKIEIL